MSERLRFGLIGCGAQGRHLSHALNITGLGKLVACADVKPGAAEEAVPQCGYREAYTDGRETQAGSLRLCGAPHKRNYVKSQIMWSCGPKHP